MQKDEELAQIAGVFENLGAEKDSAKVMAKQLLKRAQQIADERGIPYLKAVESLLKQVVEARNGS